MQNDAPSPLYVPTAQFEHVASPSWLKLPAVQADGSADTSRQEYPAGQLMHSVEPSMEEYVPLVHGLQEVEPPREARPAGQSSGACVTVRLWYGMVLGVCFAGAGSAARIGARQRYVNTRELRVSKQLFDNSRALHVTHSYRIR